ncbi:hypothetical protein E4T56_gene7570, partial [Termitomyces sp. T112]
MFQSWLTTPISAAARDTSFSDAFVTVSSCGTSINVSGTHYFDARAPYSPTSYFSSQQLAKDNHVLKIDLSGNTAGAHFPLEYITYIASLENLDTNSRKIPASVFIGVGAGLGVL